MVHKDPFSSHLYLPTFPNPQSPNTLLRRGTNTLNYPKNKVLHTTTPATLCPLKKLSHPIYPKPSYRKKIIKLTAMVPEFVNLDCSFTRVTGAEHSALGQLIVEKLGLYVRSSLFKDKTMFCLAPLQYFSNN